MSPPDDEHEEGGDDDDCIRQGIPCGININRERITIPKSRHYYMQFKFTNSSTDAAIDIRNWELYYLIKTPTDS